MRLYLATEDRTCDQCERIIDVGDLVVVTGELTQDDLDGWHDCKKCAPEMYCPPWPETWLRAYMDEWERLTAERDAATTPPHYAGANPSR